MPKEPLEAQRVLLMRVVQELRKSDSLLDRVVIRFNSPREVAYRGYPRGGDEYEGGVESLHE